MIVRKSIELGGREISFETGRMAKQADGAVVIQYGGTVILATAVASKNKADYRGFFPLSVEYREKAYAAGKIPGGFFKREGRPHEKEILSARLIDRPIRPLFPENFYNEVQVVISVLSSDKQNDADVLGIIGASAALSISDIPFEGPVAGVRIGRIDGEFVINPTFEELENSDMDVVMAASEESILMVEGEAVEISEKEMLDALEFGHNAVKGVIELQKELIKEAGKAKIETEPPQIDEELVDKIRKLSESDLKKALTIKPKLERYAALREIGNSVKESLAEEYPDMEMFISEVIHDLQKEIVRDMIVNKKVRIDGRKFDDIRPITCEVSVLPRTHGSALFTRGETQSLTVTTLGTKADEQKIERLEGASWKSYTLHYNFPSFSVGEVKPFRGPSRREIGHGNLAERALKPVIPTEDVFPYTIRVVSDILESNGSSSMATVCAGSLSLMDAGVPIKEPVAGIAMGLIKEEDSTVVLTDILGDEDHIGDMDFKVAGTKNGINAFQMDIKVSGISKDIMETALERAKTARLKILDIMNQTLSKGRENTSPYAPRIMSMHIDVDDIGAVIGPGGKMIKSIVEKSGAELNIDDDGNVQIVSEDEEACKIAMDMVKGIVQKPERGMIYTGKVKKITNFGAFVEILPGKEGLLHISEISEHRIKRVEDHLKVGQEVKVKLLNVTPDGKLDLSMKAAKAEEN